MLSLEGFLRFSFFDKGFLDNFCKVNYSKIIIEISFVIERSGKPGDENRSDFFVIGIPDLSEADALPSLIFHLPKNQIISISQG
jgi:hypothetical protein